ncbi:MAG: tetratricopeptide repeat protein [Gammaproteobacteria bacterium]|nr:tetratricopeptide repeat protein [Gammaproteobacteria bacterium]
MSESREQQRAHALALVQAQKFTDARKLYRALCESNSCDIDAWFMLGAVNAQLSRFDEATTCCQNVLQMNPAHIQALYILAQIRLQKSDFNQAIKTFRKILKINPDQENARNGLKHAQSMLKTKHRRTPGKGNRNAERLFKEGWQFQQRGEWKAAYECYQLALEKEPNALPLLTNIGFVCRMLNQYEAATGYHERALAIDPGLIDERYNLGVSYKEVLRLSQASECFQQVLRVQPDNAAALHGLGIVNLLQGHADKAEEVMRQALDLKPDDLAARSRLLMTMNYYSNEPEQLFQEHIEWDRFYPYPAQIHKHATGDGDRRLKVGYLSPDFCGHPVALFMEPLLAHHDSDSFEIFCYSDVANADGITVYLQQLVPNWRDVRQLGDDALGRQIQHDRIDILVDLAGHTPNNRLGVFARKPTPVQVSYLGYPNTSGLAAMDYRLTDAWADPPGKTEHLHSETLVRLKDGFLCYRPLEGTVITPSPCIKKGYTTFGSFNNLAKVTPDVIAQWASLLQAAPASRLLLKTKPLRDERTRETIYQQFLEHGIQRERVDLVGWTDKMSDHMALYGQVDIGLDPFPYNGTTTTCEAIWMGVPVVTLAGQTHSGRVGVSLLSTIGLTEFIAKDMHDYIDIAIRLASDVERLSRLRHEMRDRVSASSLCDAAAFANHVENAYREMWRNWCDAKTETGSRAG